MLFPAIVEAQQQKQLDSLHTELKNAINDTVKMSTLGDLSSYYWEVNRDSAMHYTDAAIAMAKKINQQLWVATLLLGKAYLIQKQAKFSLSLKLCNEALAIVQDEKNERDNYMPKDAEFASEPGKLRKAMTIGVFHQLANTWSDAGNKEKAIQYYKEEIRISKELNSTVGLVTSNMNIGSIYCDMDKSDSAMIYSTRHLKTQISLVGKIMRDSYLMI